MELLLLLLETLKTKKKIIKDLSYNYVARKKYKMLGLLLSKLQGL